MRMTNPHISIYKPQNIDKRLWRYMSLQKFMDLLQRSCLWFTRLDHFHDPYEGFLPEIITRLANDKERPEFAQFQYDPWRKRACANCWYMSDYESAAMWDLYSKEGGIAITSHVSRLGPSIAPEFDSAGWGLYGNAVKYIDFQKEKVETIDAQGSIILAQELHCKRKSFEHEQEYRLTVRLEERELIADLPGKSVPIELNTLVEMVYVSPTAPRWVVAVVQNVAEKYGLIAPVVQSDLYAPVVK
ncbi:DUF2971 domain-containing protein [Paludibaculum fermentans]|uniref:DUF2971 domain-containing protein n=1 Tax=Paludibaculum fermentans TaxID=1473598 RepID=UPI003EBAC9E9